MISHRIGRQKAFQLPFKNWRALFFFFTKCLQSTSILSFICLHNLTFSTKYQVCKLRHCGSWTIQLSADAVLT